VAFKTPDGHRVVIVVNTSHSKQVFQIAWRGKSMTATLEDGAVGTYIW
jgi:glucosylceramidase